MARPRREFLPGNYTRCPLCRAMFVPDPDVEPIARRKGSGEPVAICEGCTRIVRSVRRAQAQGDQREQ